MTHSLDLLSREPQIGYPSLLALDSSNQCYRQTWEWRIPKIAEPTYIPWREISAVMWENSRETGSTNDQSSRYNDFLGRTQEIFTGQKLIHKLWQETGPTVDSYPLHQSLTARQRPDEKTLSTFPSLSRLTVWQGMTSERWDQRCD